jgi:hypothetical protein
VAAVLHLDPLLLPTAAHRSAIAIAYVLSLMIMAKG